MTTTSSVSGPFSPSIFTAIQQQLGLTLEAAHIFCMYLSTDVQGSVGYPIAVLFWSRLRLRQPLLTNSLTD